MRFREQALEMAEEAAQRAADPQADGCSDSQVVVRKDQGNRYAEVDGYTWGMKP